MWQWVVGNWQTYVVAALAVIGGASVVVKAIAPFTESDFDDRLLACLVWLHEKLSKVALNP